MPSDQDDVSEERLRRIVREEVRAGNRRTLRSVLLVVGGIVVGYLAFSALLGVLLGTVGLGRTVAVAGALLVVGVGWALLDTLRRR